MLSIFRILFLNNQVINKYRVFIKIIAYFFLIFFILRYAQEIHNGGNSWKTGDWLINYEGGWVRRGLIGQGLYNLSAVLGVNLLWSAFFLQSLIYFFIAYLVLKLYFSAEREVSSLAIIFSPAFIFLFPFNDFQGGFRKEIIVFLSFCLLAVGLMKGHFNQRYLVLSLILYIIAVFSHEIAAFCLVFFLYLLFESKTFDPTKKGIIRFYLICFSIAGVSGLTFSVLYPGTVDTSNAICESIKILGLNQDICEGSIDSLKYDLSYGSAEVIKRFPQYLRFYPILIILSMIPVFLTDWWKKRLLLILSGFISMIPLFIIAIDWGRFIHVYIFMTFVFLLFDSCNNFIEFKKVPLGFVLMYVCLWGIAHADTHLPSLIKY